MKKIIILFALLLSVYAVHSQNTIFIGAKSYPCTDTFTLQSPEVVGGNNLDISIAKNNDDSGFIILSFKSYDKQVRISGNIKMVLEDGSLIGCVDRGIYDYVDRTSTAVYKLTSNEMTKLSLYNIHSLRYTIKCFGCESFNDGDFTVINYPANGQFSHPTIEIHEKVNDLINNY